MRDKFSGARGTLGMLAVSVSGLLGGCAIGNQIVSESGPIYVENGGFWGSKFPRYRIGSFEEAERMMSRLVRGAKNEDKWIVYTEGDGIIVQDIGEKPETVNDPNAPLLQQSYFSIKTNTEIEEQTLRRLPPGTVVKHYHIHPLDEEEASSTDSDDPILRSAKPSDDDFFSRAWRQRTFKEKYPHLTLEPSTVIGFGYAIDYWVSDEMETKVQDEWKGFSGVRSTYLDTLSRWAISTWGTENRLSVSDLFQKLDERGLHTEVRRVSQ